MSPPKLYPHRVQTGVTASTHRDLRWLAKWMDMEFNDTVRAALAAGVAQLLKTQGKEPTDAELRHDVDRAG